MDTIEIQFNQQKIVLRLLGSFAFIAMGVVLIWVIAPTQSRWPPIFVQILGAISMLFFGSTFIAGLKLLARKGPAIILNEEGLIDNSSYVSAGLVKWNDMTALRIEQVKSTKFLAIYVSDPWVFIQNAAGFKRWLMKGNLRQFNTPINLSAATLDCSFEDLEKWVTERFSKSIKDN